MRWQDKLTKKQLRHLENVGIRTLRDFQRSRAWQVSHREKKLAAGFPPGIAEPCWECAEIARRLGIEE